MEQIVNYPTTEAQFGSVVRVAGREFVIMPYESGVCIPSEIVDFVRKHPESDDLNHQIEIGVKRLLADIEVYLRDALAVTAVEEESGDERYSLYRLVLPVLMPKDTHDRWAVKDDEAELAYQNRLQETIKQWMTSEKPYSFKLVERKEKQEDVPAGLGPVRFMATGTTVMEKVDDQYIDRITIVFPDEDFDDDGNGEEHSCIRLAVLANADELLASNGGEQDHTLAKKMRKAWMDEYGAGYADFITYVNIQRRLDGKIQVRFCAEFAH